MRESINITDLIPREKLKDRTFEPNNLDKFYSKIGESTDSHTQYHAWTWFDFCRYYICA